MKQRVLFFTGASGTLGKELLEKLTESTYYAKIVVLSHVNGIQTKNSRVISVKGDITKKNLGLSTTLYRELQGTLTDILHAAANVSFSLPRSTAMKINFLGTKHITTFAEHCKNLQEYTYTSTVYVCGKRSGTIQEEELLKPTGFVNTYEESKYYAENFLQQKKDRLPIRIIRLSTIIGREADGTVTTFHGIHYALKLYFHSLAPFIPATPTSPVDLISLEYARDTTLALLHNPKSIGKTFHIVSGQENVMTIQEVVDASYAAFTKSASAWTSKTIEKPMFIDQETFSLFSDSARQLDNKIFLKVIESIETFAPQLLYPKNFEHTNTDLFLKGTGITAKPMQEYFGKIVGYCVLSNWGKKPYNVSHHE